MYFIVRNRRKKEERYEEEEREREKKWRGREIQRQGEKRNN